MPEHNAFITCQYYEAIFEIQIKKISVAQIKLTSFQDLCKIVLKVTIP